VDITTELEQIRAAIRAGQFQNEAAVSRGIVMRLLNSLGWPVFDTALVVPEYPLDTLRVDYALCYPQKKPLIIVEVKAIGKAQGADTQLLEYAFKSGVPMAILTDGQEWHFYLPAGQGSFQERRFYKLDILERDAKESSERFNRYCSYENVRSGHALQAAREDYDSAVLGRTVKKTLPSAWKKLLEEPDSLLIDLLSEKVADLCGYRPDPDTVSEFLRVRTVVPLPAAPTYPPEVPKQLRPRIHSSGGIGFSIFGKWVPCRSAAEVLASVFEEFSARDPQFLNRFASRKHGKRRRYAAPNREDLYPDRPDLMPLSKQLSSGWWLGTNYSKQNIQQIIQLACEVAQVDFGSDLTIELGK